jgi:hypothetical protein
MQIVLDTSNVSDKDVELLAAFVDVLNGKTATAAAPAKRTRKKAEPEPAEEPPSETVTQDVETVSEGPPPPPSGSNKEAVAFVTKQVADGKARRIKAALTKQGVSRLSELPDESLGEFMAEAKRLVELSDEEFKQLDEAG